VLSGICLKDGNGRFTRNLGCSLGHQAESVLWSWEETP
jgi:hypothetical protein